MKKLFALVAIAGLAVSLVGCGDAKKEAPKKDAPAAEPAK